MNAVAGQVQVASAGPITAHPGHYSLTWNSES
jgi:hypothetical protein